MGEYRKKPIVIEAWRWEPSANPMSMPSWLLDAVGPNPELFDEASGELTIRTLEGDMRVQVGDWIIRGVKDELYPCKDDVFEATYEPA